MKRMSAEPVWQPWTMQRCGDVVGGDEEVAGCRNNGWAARGSNGEGDSPQSENSGEFRKRSAKLRQKDPEMTKGNPFAEGKGSSPPTRPKKWCEKLRNVMSSSKN